MIIRGKPYKAEGEDAEARGLVAIRNVYRTVGEPTPNQRTQIEWCEKFAHGECHADAAYSHAERLGIELDSEEQHKNGRWYPSPPVDTMLTVGA